MLLSGKINKGVSLLIIAGLFFALITPGPAGAASREGGSSGTSLLSGMGSRFFICLPKETLTEMGGPKPYINSMLWILSDAWLALQNDAAVDIAECPKIYHSSKIVEITNKKDGKK